MPTELSPWAKSPRAKPTAVWFNFLPQLYEGAEDTGTTFGPPWPAATDDQPVDLARRAHALAAPRYGGHGIAVAQPDAARRAGRDPRPAVRRAARFWHRQGLSLQRVCRLLHADGGSRCAVRRGARRHPQGVDRRRAVLPSRQVLAIR